MAIYIDGTHVNCLNIGEKIDLVKIPFTIVNNTYINENNGSAVSYYGWTASSYVDISDFSKIYFAMYSTDSFDNSRYNAFYNENKQYVGKFNWRYITVSIPSNVKYLRFSASGNPLANATLIGELK